MGKALGLGLNPIVVINKVDLAPHCQVDLDACEAHLRTVNPSIEIMRISATAGTGMQDWLDWLQRRCADKRRHAANPA